MSSTNQELKNILSTQQDVSPTEYNGIDGKNNKFISPVPGAMTYVREQNVCYNLSPVNAITSGLFSNSVPLQFRISPGFCSEIQLIMINLTCIESGGTNSVTPICVPYLFDQIQLCFNGSSNPVVTIFGDELYANFQLWTSEQIANLLAFNQQNMTPATFGNETPIPAGGTAFYSIPLLSVLNGINPQTLTSDIVINVIMRQNPVASGTGILQLTDMQLRVLTSRNAPSVDNKIVMDYSMNMACLPYTFAQQSTSTITLSPGILTEIPLNGINGLCSTMFIMIRSSKSTTNAGIRLFSIISGTDPFESTGMINLVDQSKQPLLGSGALFGKDFRGRNSAFYTPSLFSSVVPVYFYYFPQNPVSSIINGTNNGFNYFNGTQFLQLTPGPTFTAGTYTVDVYFKIYACLQQIKGVITRSM
jgi:hypothetical protein